MRTDKKLCYETKGKYVFFIYLAHCDARTAKDTVGTVVSGSSSSSTATCKNMSMEMKIEIEWLWTPSAHFVVRLFFFPQDALCYPPHLVCGGVFLITMCFFLSFVRRLYQYTGKVYWLLQIIVGKYNRHNGSL